MNEDAQLAARDKIISAAAGLVARHGTDRIGLGPGVVPESPMDQALRGLDSIEALRAWAEHYVEQLEHGEFHDESVLGAIAGPRAAVGPAARADVGARLGRWIAVLARGLRRMRDRGVLCPETDPDELASALLAMLLGGILLAKTRQDVAPLRSAVTAMMARVQSLTADGEAV
jgi:hypothetical protein